MRRKSKAESEQLRKVPQEFIKEVRRYGERMNRKEKTIEHEEKMWNADYEREFVEQVQRYGNNCRKFEYIAAELAQGRFSKEFLREKKLQLHESRVIKSSKKNQRKKKGKTGSWKIGGEAAPEAKKEE